MMASYVLVIFQFLALYILQRIILHHVLYTHFWHPLSIYPGPFLASITNIWKFHHFLRGNLHIIEQGLHKEHGPVIRTGPNSLSFSTLEAFESIYGYNHGFEKGDFYSFARDANDGSSNIFSSRTYVEHRERRRKVVGAALTSSHIRSYAPVVSKHVQHFVSTLNTLSSEAKHNTVNIAEIIHALTFNTILEIIYGPSITIKGEPWTETVPGEGTLPAFRMMAKFGWGAAFVPWLAWVMGTKPMIKMTRKPTFNADGVMTGVGALASKVQSLIFQKPELVTKIGQDSIVKHMLYMEKGDSRYMEKGDIFKESFNLAFAGPGSTAAAITGVLYQLGTQQGLPWQEKIRTELSESNEPSESITLNAVIKESLRYSAPFSVAFPRGVQLGAEKAVPGIDKPLPIGTLVSANSWIVSHEKKVWGEDAEEWKPDRWIPSGSEGEEEGEAERKARDDKFVVFSKGPRGCIGKDIAMMMISESVAGVVSKWKIESVGEMKANGWLEMQIESCEMKLSKI